MYISQEFIFSLFSKRFGSINFYSDLCINNLKIITMCMSDTAEDHFYHNYPKTVYLGKTFFHIPNSKCGHYVENTGNGRTSEYLNDINCYACLKLIKENGNVYELKEGLSKMQKSQIARDKKRFEFGKCECGRPLHKRTNSKTKLQFLGCVNYPKCNKTYPINSTKVLVVWE